MFSAEMTGKHLTEKIERTAKSQRMLGNGEVCGDSRLFGQAADDTTAPFAQPSPELEPAHGSF